MVDVEVAIAVEAPSAEPVTNVVAEEPAAEAAPVDMESYYSFTWAGRAAGRRDRPQGQPRTDGEARPPRDRRPRGGDRSRSETPKVEGTVEGVADAVTLEGAPAADKPRGKRDHARKAPRDDSRYKPQPGSKPEGGDKPVVRDERPREDRPREDRNSRPDRKPYPKRDDDRSNKPQVFEARPARDKGIDPDNPFAAALAAFKAK